MRPLDRCQILYNKNGLAKFSVGVYTTFSGQNRNVNKKNEKKATRVVLNPGITEYDNISTVIRSETDGEKKNKRLPRCHRRVTVDGRGGGKKRGKKTPLGWKKKKNPTSTTGIRHKTVRARTFRSSSP